MADIEFGRLVDIHLRDAWKNEATDFTPWLAENIDHLSEVIGIPLELTGTEVAVQQFSADILARNPMDDSVVLIENQLEQTDHTHLGQIMTYLAGLNAQTVIWIARNFREPHLSAVKWLNEHTSDGFSFFAIQARVVKIGGSLKAPIFDVIEKPNDWDRSIKSMTTRDSDGAAAKAAQTFWAGFLNEHPNASDLGGIVTRRNTNWLYLSKNPEIILSIYVGKSASGGFLRGASGADPEMVHNLLAPHANYLEQHIGSPLSPNANGQFFGTHLPKGYLDKDCWPEIMDWFGAAIKTYKDAIDGAFGAASKN